MKGVRSTCDVCGKHLGGTYLAAGVYCSETCADGQGETRRVGTSPDLLKACKLAAEWIEHPDRFAGHDLLPDLLAAIASAEDHGETERATVDAEGVMRCPCGSDDLYAWGEACGRYTVSDPNENGVIWLGYKDTNHEGQTFLGCDCCGRDRLEFPEGFEIDYD